MMLQTLDDIWMHFLRVRETSVSLLLHHVVAIVDALLLLVAVSAHSKPKKGRRRMRCIHSSKVTLHHHQWRSTLILLPWAGNVSCVFYAPKIGSAECLKRKKGAS